MSDSQKVYSAKLSQYTVCWCEPLYGQANKYSAVKFKLYTILYFYCHFCSGYINSNCWLLVLVALFIMQLIEVE